MGIYWTAYYGTVIVLVWIDWEAYILVGEKENKQNPIKYVGTQKCESSYGSL